MNRQEEWRSVLGFPKYEVSDMGVIRGLRGKGKIMRPTLSKPGYLRLNLFNKGEKSYKSVHVVVLTAFKGPRPDGYDARHINGIKQDNRNINLEWGTSVQNMNDKIAHGIRKAPVNTDVFNRRMKFGMSQKKFAKLFGVRTHTVSDWETGKCKLKAECLEVLNSL